MASLFLPLPRTPTILAAVRAAFYSCRFHATPCASSFLCSPSHDFLASTKSTRCYFSPRSKGTNASSSSSSCLHSWCIPHNFCFVTKSPVWRLSSRILQALSYSSDHPKTLKIFIAEMEFWLQIILAQPAHLTKGASTWPRVPYYSPKQSGLATFLALLLIAVRRPLLTTSALLPGQLLTRLPLEISPLAWLSKSVCYSKWGNATSCASLMLIHFHDFLASTRPCLASHLIRSNLPYLSPSKLGMNFYLISQMTFAHLTSNSMLCDNTFLCPRRLFSSPISSWLCSPQPREATKLSLFQPPGVYKEPGMG